MCGKSIDPGSPLARADWMARWLQDPVFAKASYRELISPDRSEACNGEIRNIHTLFRREMILDGKPIRQARLYITADDCYQLYINGCFIGLGPAPAYPSHYHYNAWDVTDALQAGGRNCIGVHVFYQGLHSLTFTSGDNLQGLLLQMEVEFEDGSAVTCVSDGEWRCLRVEAYESRQVYGYQTSFSEHIDLRLLPAGWREAGFDDSQWQRPLAGAVPEIYALSPQPTPPVAVLKRRPARVIKIGAGHFFIDFGTELSGVTAFTVTGAAGHKVEIRHGEELDGENRVRYKMRCNCTYQEFCTLSGRPDEQLEFFDYKGFRYVEVLDWPEELTEERVWANERHYPFPEEASSFTSSNSLLNDIWKLCRNGVRVGTLDTYLDCPTREKGGFMGDGFVTGMSHLILTGDARILRKFLADVASTSRYCPGLHSTAPNYVNGELAEYSMLWPVLLEYYYQWTGDAAFVRKMMPVLEGMLTHYAAFENADGLLQDVCSKASGRYAVLIDWPGNLRDDYDDPWTEKSNPRGVVNTMVQGFYLGALKAAAHLAEVADANALKQTVAWRMCRLRSAVLDKLRDPETGLFVDRNGSSHSALHANVTPIMSGMLAPEDLGPVVDLIRKKRLSCGVYFSFFVLKALYTIGEAELAYELITSRDRHSWHSMLAAGATTCMEAWAPDLKWNTSWCHPWSSAPISMVAYELMGVRPGRPGWGEILFAPQVPVGLESASLVLTIPQGRLEAGFRRDGNETIYRLTVPAGCTLRCQFKAQERVLSMDCTEVDRTAVHVIRAGREVCGKNALPR